MYISELVNYSLHGSDLINPTHITMTATYNTLFLKSPVILEKFVSLLSKILMSAKLAMVDVLKSVPTLLEVIAAFATQAIS